MLEPVQLDVLTELINIGIGRATSMLNQMVQLDIRLDVPSIRILTAQELRQEADAYGDDIFSIVRLGFEGCFHGTAQLVLPATSATHLVAAVTGEEPDSPDVSALRGATLNEIGNILLNGVMGSLVNSLQGHLDFALPEYLEDTAPRTLVPGTSQNDEMVLFARARFATEDGRIDGQLIVLFEAESTQTLIDSIDNITPDSMAG